MDKFSQMAQMVSIGPKWSQMVLKNLMDLNCTKWSKIFSNCSKWSQIVSSGPKFSQMSQIVQNDPKWSQIILKFPKLT